MQLGRFTIEQLSEGQFELFPDGKINRTPVPESQQFPDSFIAETNSLAGINPVYVTDGTHHLLLDAGLGWGLDAGSGYNNVSNIVTNLDVFGITPDDITHVILSHMHYDHAAGTSFTDKEAATRPTFPNARLIVQQSEWDFALRQVQDQAPASRFYNLDDFYRLHADGFFDFIDDERKQIVPGITIYRTGGHTPGHQVVEITDEENKAYFFGDLIPTEYHLNQADIAGTDTNGIQTKKAKLNLLRKAYRENAFLFFYHSIHSKVGQLEKDEDRNYVLKEI